MVSRFLRHSKTNETVVHLQAFVIETRLMRSSAVSVVTVK